MECIERYDIITHTKSPAEERIGRRTTFQGRRCQLNKSVKRRERSNLIKNDDEENVGNAVAEIGFTAKLTCHQPIKSLFSICDDGTRASFVLPIFYRPALYPSYVASLIQSLPQSLIFLLDSSRFQLLLFRSSVVTRKAQRAQESPRFGPSTGGRPQSNEGRRKEEKETDGQRDSYLAGCHVADGTMRLDRLQLVQTPVQLFQRFHGQSCVGFIWKVKKRERGT